MAYQSLYRRYRPQRFGDVRGQEHVVRALRNAVREDRVGHAYLFSGPRGTGKTTAARILAKALNCPNLDDGEPCGKCESCVAIAEGSSFDVFELDAASNNGVDAIRDLTERASQSTPGRTKVYILDEVHMLSTAAANALLKTLEEPPDHVVFVLATTDPQKVLATIRSRTQHFDVHLLDSKTLRSLVDDVIADAGLSVDEDGRDWVLRAGGGSARDTLSALERVVAYGGVPDDGTVVDELAEAICDSDTGAVLAAVERAVAAGRAPRTIGEELIARLRDIFLAAVGSDLSRLADTTAARITDQAQRMGARGATHALEVLGDAFVGIQDAPDPRVPLELALVRLTRPELDASPAALLGRIERLEHQIAQGAAAPAANPQTASPQATTAPPESPRPTEETPAPAPPAAPPPAKDSGPGGPASAARQALASKRSGQDRPAERRTPPVAPESAPAAATSAPAEPATAEPAPAEPTSAEPPPAEAAAAEPAQVETAPPEPAQKSAGVPDRDQLTMAWGDSVLGKLPQKAKARYGAGRFVGVEDGTALFALPNEVHRKRCEELKPTVEAALAEHFGTAVPLRLVTEESGPQASSGGDSPGGGGKNDSEPEEESIDPDELTDATDVAGDQISRLTDMFPGAELIEEDPVQ